MHSLRLEFHLGLWELFSSVCNKRRIDENSETKTGRKRTMNSFECPECCSSFDNEEAALVCCQFICDSCAERTPSSSSELGHQCVYCCDRYCDECAEDLPGGLCGCGNDVKED